VSGRTTNVRWNAMLPLRGASLPVCLIGLRHRRPPATRRARAFHSKSNVQILRLLPSHAAGYCVRSKLCPATGRLEFFGLQYRGF
jgi:hypothetical protein